MYPSVANQQSVKKSHLWVAYGRPRLGHEVGSPDGLGRVESPQRIGRMDAALPQRRTHFPQVNCEVTNKANRKTFFFQYALLLCFSYYNHNRTVNNHVRALQSDKPETTDSAGKQTSSKSAQQPAAAAADTSRFQGTAKRRQYYNKQVAQCLGRSEEQDSSDNEEVFHLYCLRMRLTCPIPDDQNTRGRKIFAPEEASQRFGILVRGKGQSAETTLLPPVSEFPIYTRSGEVFLSVGESRHATIQLLLLTE